MKNSSIPGDGAVDHLQRPKAPNGARDSAGWRAPGTACDLAQERPVPDRIRALKRGVAQDSNCATFLAQKALFHNNLWHDVWHKCLPEPATLCHFLTRFVLGKPSFSHFFL